jgi:proteasome lid subunit RPN8/RPN11
VKSIAAALLLLIAGRASAELIRDPVVLSFCRVLARNAIAERSREQGAFVVRTPEGLTYFVAWPRSDERHILRWHGRFPDGTVAILHTHEGWLPEPSKLDRKAASETGIPIYVITPSQISKTIGGESQVVMMGDWLRGSR